MSKVLRLFWAFHLPDEVRESLITVQQKLKKTNADIRFVRPEGIHLTVKFLGNVEQSMVNNIIIAVEPVVKTYKPLRLTPSGVGAFPGIKNPRVVWVGLLGDITAISQLAGDINRVLKPLGFEPEKRPFKSHLTIGRVKSNRGQSELIKAISELSDYRSNEFQVDKLILYKSDLQPTGAIYSELIKIEMMNR